MEASEVKWEPDLSKFEAPRELTPPMRETLLSEFTMEA
jgi:hypothetical protein